jgi:DNA-binding beta-propeller fold protein YncE
MVSTLAGDKYGFRDGTGKEASFHSPIGVAVNASGNVYVADRENHRIRKITPAGVVTTIMGHVENGITGSDDGIGTAASIAYPYGIVLDARNIMYVTEPSNNKIRKIIVH